MTDQDMEDEQAVELVVDGILDLHTFSPKDIRYLVPDYLDACHAAGIFHVRIIHGKGIGNLRRSVHAILARHPLVRQFTLAGQESGSWGATLVELLPHLPKQSAEKSGLIT